MQKPEGGHPLTATRLLCMNHRTTWRTPKQLYAALNEEFSFDFDPCPSNPGFNGLLIPWGERNYVNPPYGAVIRLWLRKALEEWSRGKTSVFLLPAFTDVGWFHTIVMRYAAEIRFIRGRLHFDDKPGNAPVAHMVVIFKP